MSARLAQSVEHQTLNLRVVGSSPTLGDFLFSLVFFTVQIRFSFTVQLYPYHLQDMLVRGLRVTPFSYYSNMMFDIMSNEKSYDSLPNFTAADGNIQYNFDKWFECYYYLVVRLLGVGRNQYIDSMNLTKSKVRLWLQEGVPCVLEFC